MAKAVVTIGYVQYILEVEQATMICAALADADILTEEGWGSDRKVYMSHQVDTNYPIKVISDYDYKLMKLRQE